MSRAYWNVSSGRIERVRMGGWGTNWCSGIGDLSTAMAIEYLITSL